jgi:hypothetical protein
MSFAWLGLTPKATAVLNATPSLFVTLILVIIGLTALGTIAWYIHFETNKVYKKPKPIKEAGKK